MGNLARRRVVHEITKTTQGDNTRKLRGNIKKTWQQRQYVTAAASRVQKQNQAKRRSMKQHETVIRHDIADPLPRNNNFNTFRGSLPKTPDLQILSRNMRLAFRSVCSCVNQRESHLSVIASDCNCPARFQSPARFPMRHLANQMCTKKNTLRCLPYHRSRSKNATFRCTDFANSVAMLNHSTCTTRPLISA
jgi:hypothetical protein